MKLIARCNGREVAVEVEKRLHGYQLKIGDAAYDVDVAVPRPAEPGGLTIKSLLIDGRHHEAAVRPLAEGRYRVSAGGSTEMVELLDPLAVLAEQAAGGAKAGKRLITAYMPGVVKRVLVAAGDAVRRGQGLAVLEAMKMENEIEAEADGTVAKVLVKDGQAVEGGDPLFEIE
ncbi:MAG: biotin/lipoyl-binding protein [Acidobacteria bacterium]|nr:MAG: biotin/lipoyl-binding protein [Acidobacteriota bacterium]